jgi:hypothetical protein
VFGCLAQLGHGQLVDVVAVLVAAAFHLHARRPIDNYTPVARVAWVVTDGFDFTPVFGFESVNHLMKVRSAEESRRFIPR